MDRLFLRLELDDLGIKASVAGAGTGQAQGECQFRYEDLPASEEERPVFDAAMDEIAARLDLSSCSQAILFVSPLWISFRSVELPFSSAKKIRQVLEFELESLLPLSNEDYVSDFIRPKSRGEKRKEGSRILTASIFESRIRQATENLRSKGIQTRLITSLGHAEAVAYLGIQRERANFVFVTLTDTFISLSIFLGGSPVSIRSFPSSGTDAREMAIRIRQAVTGFNQRTGNQRFFDILVCPDQDPEPAREVIRELEKVFDPAGIHPAELNSRELLERIPPHKREKFLFNFCQGKYGASSFVKKYLGSLVAALVLSAAVFGLFMTGIAMENTRLTRRIAAIDARALEMFRQTFPDQKKIQDPYLQMKANLREVLKTAGANGKKSVEDRQFKSVQILNELSDKIDASIDTDISRFLFNNGRIVLSGSTDNFNNVDKIKSRIESSDMFKTVEISSAAADKKGNRVNFKFIIEM